MKFASACPVPSRTVVIPNYYHNYETMKFENFNKKSMALLKCLLYLREHHLSLNEKVNKNANIRKTINPSRQTRSTKYYLNKTTLPIFPSTLFFVIKPLTHLK